MALPQKKFYTEEDYYNLSEDVRAELIDGQFYNMSFPSRVHQELPSAMYVTIANYIKEKGGSCRHPIPATTISPSLACTTAPAFVNTGLLIRRTMKSMYTTWKTGHLLQKHTRFVTL